MASDPQTTPERSMPIPVAELERAHRKLCRRVASALMAAMAETDVGFPEIAERLSVSEAEVRRRFKRLVDGTGTDLRTVSDLSFAMGCEFQWTVHALPQREIEPPAPDTDQEHVA